MNKRMLWTEEVTDNTSVTTSTRLPVPAPTFATTTASTDMAGQEDQVEIVEGEEPLAPPKPRKPHIKGITFREFDVSLIANETCLFCNF